MKTWFITGTSSGFGQALTTILLARGDRVAATVRQENALAELKKQHPDTLWTAKLDVTNTEQSRDVVTRAFSDLTRIDVLVNNAGYGLLGAAEELSDQQIKDQIDTNLIGSIQMTRAFLPYLRKQGGGRILQLASMGGQVAFPAMSLYHATKWGIEGFFEALIQEVADFNIQVTIIEPGSARTNFAKSGMKIAEPLDVYENTAVGQFKKGAIPTPGDPGKMAQAMIACAEMPKAPKRLALGSDAYQMIGAALRERLANLESLKDSTLSTDVAE